MNNSHPFSDKLPELNLIPLFDMINLSFENLTEKQRKYLLEYVFAKLGIAFGGFNQFWQDEEEMRFIKEGWTVSWSDLTVKEILSGLYSILKGQTRYISKAPRAPLEFYHICKNARTMPDIRKEPLNSNCRQITWDEEGALERRKAMAEFHLKKIKAILPGIYSRI